MKSTTFKEFWYPQLLKNTNAILLNANFNLSHTYLNPKGLEIVESPLFDNWGWSNYPHSAKMRAVNGYGGSLGTPNGDGRPPSFGQRRKGIAN
jgi:hypothetical protein